MSHFTSFTARGVVPLTIDDSDPVAAGHLQLSMGIQGESTAGVDLNTVLFNPVFGLNERAEMGLIFGDQWRNGADDVTDLTLETKWHVFQSADHGWKYGLRVDLKLPTASSRQNFGTGKVDLDAVLICTHSSGNLSIDWNVGYTAANLSGGLADDVWLVGQAMRYQLTKSWMLFAEIYANLPLTTPGGYANLFFDGGVQYSLRENLLLAALLGSSVGRDSPDGRVYLGLSWLF